MKETDIQISNMSKTKTINWKILTLLQLNFIIVSHQSIAGITYQDHFDFEERYRNLHECDPFYWHPLHLPEQCAEMFEKLIRSRVATAFNTPVKVVTKKENQLYNHYYQPSEPGYGYPNYDANYDTRSFGYPMNSYDADNLYGYGNFQRKEEQLTPYEKMLEFIRSDVMKNPTAPVIGNSNFGPVAMYEQPISKKTETYIKKIARMYADAGRRQNADDGYYYAKIEVPSKKTNGNKNEVNKNDPTLGNNNPEEDIGNVLDNATNQNNNAKNLYKAKKKKAKKEKKRMSGLSIA